MNQHEICNKGPLLDEKGHLKEAGYAKSLILDYDRKAIKAHPLRIKEWDYYYIGNQNYGVALTISDNSYMGLDSISLLDFRVPFEITNSPMQIMTLGKKNFPSTSEKGDVASCGKNHSMSFKHYGDYRILHFEMENFKDGKAIKGEIRLDCPKMDSMVIATPFKENEKAFYYNQKINCMPASGDVYFGDDIYHFDAEDSFAVLDWGRGVWTYENTWYWGSLSTRLNGELFGFNIGYGFGDTSAASENMLFYKGKAHKLSQVQFNIPFKDGKEDYLSNWTFTSDDGRFEMQFEPVLDRIGDTDFKVLCSIQHQVFGYFKGQVILDDGEVLKLDKVLGFAEKVHNKW